MARFKKIIFIILYVTLANTAFSKSPPPGTGTANVPANILIMLDNSGSMSARLYNSVQLYYPLDVDVDSQGNVYVLEYYNNRIMVFNSSGSFVRSFGGYGTSCNRWRYARQFSIHNDIIYLADTYNYRVKKLSLTGGCLANRNTVFSYPTSIAVNNRNVFVGNSGTRIETFYTSNLQQSGYQTFSSGDLYYAWGMSMNKAGNKLIVANYNGNRLSEFSVSSGRLSLIRKTSNSYSSSNGYFRRATDAVYDSNGNVYASDLYNHRIQKFNSSLSYQAKYGSYSTSNPFRYPYGMGIDSNDNIYTTDFYNYAVHKFDTNLNLVTSFGGAAGTRLDAAKKAIKKIVSNSELTKGANFGLMQWNSYPSMRVNISDSGARSIYTNVDGIRAGGGTNLYSAMLSANNYFRGNNSPIISGATCQKNFLIVISDGYWSSHSRVVGLARSMRTSNPAIKTIAVGFAVGGSTSNYTDLARAGCAFGEEPTCTKSVPLFADNETQLIAKLTDAIKQIISSTLTFTTPAVMSDTQKGDFVYQSTFEYEPYKQWKGYLKKHPINSNGTLGTAVWDAGAKLNSKSSSSRNIWTVGLSSTGLNNFTTSSRDELKSRLFPSSSPTDTQVDDLINFIRGDDRYDEDSDGNKSETRHKLADIYHSDIVVVGPPDQSTEYQNTNQDSYYRNINNYNTFKTGNTCGGSCQTRKEIVLAGSNGGMLHAFDSNNGDELWAFIPPSLHEKLSNMVSSRSNSSNAIYGVDGSPIVRDIYFNNSWKTVLISGLGAGGHSYFALDITNPNSPKHMFTVANDPFDQVVTFWDADGNINRFGYAGTSIDADKDYRKLGEAWSNPRIIRMKVPDTNNNLVDKWVAVFGGGYNGASNPNYGSAVFVMDLENDGYLVKKIDITDSSSSNIVNSIPADLTVITPDSTVKANYSGAMVYATDLEGKVTKINLTNQGTLYQTTQLFDAQSSTTNGRYIYKTAEATINDDNQLWLYFGTGDIQKIQTRNSSVQNRLYGIKDKDFPEFRTVSPAGTISNCTTAGTCPGSGQLGWYMNLPNSRKLTAMPTIQGDVVYFPLYEPTSSNVCAYGDAILSALNSKCGGANFIKKLGTGVLTKVVTNKDKIIIGISGEADKGSGFNNQGNLLIGDAVGKAPVQGIQVETWRQN